MTKHFVTVKTILVVEGDLAMREIIEESLQELRQRAERREIRLQIENEECTKQWSFEIAGATVQPICRECASPLSHEGLCLNEDCDFTARQQNET